jgi:hypothetical protein
VVGSGGLLLSAKVAGEALGLNGLSAEPEELLLEDKAPRMRELVAESCECVAKICAGKVLPIWSKFAM